MSVDGKNQTQTWNMLLVLTDEAHSTATILKVARS